MNVGSTSVDRVPAWQAGLLGCDATYTGGAMQVDTGRELALRSGAVAANEIPHGQSLRSVEVFQTLFDSRSGALGFVLTDLPLAFDSAERDLDTDYAFDLRCDVVCGSVADLPWFGKTGLVLSCQSVEVGEKPLLVFNNFKRAVCVDDGVVPGGDNLTVLGLLRVPGGRDVVLGACEDGERFDGGGEIAPLIVGAGEMSAQGAIGTFAALKHHGQVRCKEAGAAHCDERSERLRLDEGMHDIEPCLLIEFGNVHSDPCLN